jgi:hypothetical protein
MGFGGMIGGMIGEISERRENLGKEGVKFLQN